MTMVRPGENTPDRVNAIPWAMARLFCRQKDHAAEIVTADAGASSTVGFVGRRGQAHRVSARISTQR
jgi:hypothetical protein